MTSSPFTAPAAGGSYDLNEGLGHLVVVEPHTFEPDFPTKRGPADAIRVTIHDVTAGNTEEDVLLFPKVLVSSLKPRIGQKVLGRIGQGEPKPGQSAPWILTDASGDPQAVAQATAYLDAYARGQFAGPDDTPPAAPDSDDPLAALDPEARAAVEALMAKKG